MHGLVDRICKLLQHLQHLQQSARGCDAPALGSPLIVACVVPSTHPNAGTWVFSAPHCSPECRDEVFAANDLADTCRRTNRGGRKDAQDSGRGWTPYAHVLR